MRLLIITTGNNFTTSMLYKENYIIKAAIEKGHEVKVIANMYTYINGETCKLKFAEKDLPYSLVRLPYMFVINDFITNKIRRCKGYLNEVLDFRPDLIFINCAQVYDVLYCKDIKRALPNVKICMDFSTKFINSARSFLSREILHKVIYRSWIQKSLPYVDKVFYISQESMEFARDVYGISEEIMEHNNLPGELISVDRKLLYRDEIRRKHNLKSSSILFVNSGKIGKLKKTVELLKVFKQVDNNDFRLFIIGSLEQDVKDEILSLIEQDNRVEYLGFKSGAELTKYLCAADMYVQPGTISQTSQTAICCGCAISFTTLPTHMEIYNGNGYFIDSDNDMLRMFKDIDKYGINMLQKMGNKSYELAAKELSYNVLYDKILIALNPQNV